MGESASLPRSWRDLTALWFGFNQQLLAAAEAVPGAAWAHTCTIGSSEPVTLRFVLDDYVDHLLHHLRRIGLDIENLSTKTLK